MNATSMIYIVNAYEVAQNALDAKATAALFTINAKLYMPVGVGQPYVGRASILKAYKDYFDSLRSANETVLSPLVVSGSVVAYTKRVDGVPITGNPFSSFVVTWFNMTCDWSGRLRIASLSHAWDN